MKIVLLSILKIIYFTFVSSDSGIPYRMCSYEGDSYKNGFIFSINDLPKRCEVVTYGYYLFDSDSVDNVTMYKNDEAVLKSIAESGVPAYTTVCFVGDDRWEDMFFCPKTQEMYDQAMGSLLEKINYLNLSGIVLGITDIYNGTNLPAKITGLVNTLKKEVPTLKVGLSLIASHFYTKLPDNGLFDFKAVNSAIDFYDIELYTPYTEQCTPQLASTGTLITSPDPSIMSLETLGNAVSQSSMDKSKTYGRVHIYPHMSENETTYSLYCKEEGAAACEACIDNTTTLHAMGAYIKTAFKGIIVAWPQYDDINSLCGCQQSFPATNTIFDGFDGVPVTKCAKIDRK